MGGVELSGRMRRIFKFLFNLAFLAVLSGAVLAAFVAPLPSDNPGGRPSGRRRGLQVDVPSVLAAVATRGDVPVYLDAVGTVKALNTVTVRPQVDGQLIQIAFAEGQDVKKGDILARIDPSTYQATLDQALAKKAQDEAQLDNAKRDLERYNRLAQTSAGTAQQADTQRSTVAQFQAQLKSDQAQIDSARTYLNYTTIIAPIDGRTGIRNVDQGNLVKAADTSGIVTLAQLQPIAAVFNLPQQQLARVNAAKALGPVEVSALAPEAGGVIDKGVLQVVDNLVDQTTGTVKLKAEFPNRDMKLWPGAFINMRLLAETLKDVVTVPGNAVQRGPQGTFVYVVSGDIVNIRVVSVTMQDDARAVIANGLKGDEQVVTTGFAQLSDGAKVAVGSPAGAAPPADAPPRPRREGAGQGRGQGQGQGGGRNRQKPATPEASAQTPAPAPNAAPPPS